MAESLVELATREGQNIIAQAITQTSSIVVTNAGRAEQAADRAEEAMARAESAGSSSEAAKREAVESAEQATLIYNSFLQQYGYPFTAATAAAMTDTTKIYVYTGSETGYVNGNWYYYDGAAWVSGGVYNAVAFDTDTTLTISGAAADAKATGDRFNNVISDNILSATVTSVGWRLNQSDGLCSRNNNYNLLKFKITPGEIYEIVSDDRFQFQDSASIPSYGTNQHLIGSTYLSGTFFLIAPPTATDLIVSTLNEDSTASVTLKNITTITYNNSETLKDAVLRERIEPTLTVDGWELLNTGLSSHNTGRKLLKYSVTEGSTIYIKTPVPPTNGASYQFQTNSSVGTSSNPYLVGDPILTATEEYITVPETATWLIISALSTDEKSGVWRSTENTIVEKQLSKILSNNIVNENRDATNKILASRWLRSTTATPLSLLWFSDIHRNKTNLERIIEYRDYLKSISAVDDAIATGDLVSGSSYEASGSTYYENFWYNTPGTEDILIAVGNHEWYAQGSSPHGKITIGEINELFFDDFDNWGAVRQSNYPFYYKDYTEQGIRLIVTDPAIEAEADETTWLTTTLEDARTQGLTVVIASHYLMLNSSKEIQSATIIDNDWTDNVTRQETTMTMNYDWTGSCDIVKCVTDFIDNGGSFLCYIVGHWHWDFLCYPTGHPDQLIISIASASDNRTQTKLSTNDLPRFSDTRTQDAFNVITFDAENKIIKCVRVGANMNMYEQPRTAFAYDVTNKRFLSVI